MSQARIRSFSLISDCAYVAQNASRLLRGLFEVAIRRGWPTMSYRLLNLCKMIDKRAWPDTTPLRQACRWLLGIA